jgi:hypothetical protein
LRSFRLVRTLTLLWSSTVARLAWPPRRRAMTGAADMLACPALVVGRFVRQKGISPRKCTEAALSPSSKSTPVTRKPPHAISWKPIPYTENKHTHNTRRTH